MTESEGSRQPLIPKDASTSTSTSMSTSTSTSTTTGNMDVEDRDPKNINLDSFKINFEDVIAEPAGMYSLDIVWKASYAVFTYSQLFLYRSLTAILSVLLSLVWGSVFALLMFLHIWVTRPCIKSCLQCIVGPYLWLVNTFLAPVLKVYSSVVVFIRKKQ